MDCADLCLRGNRKRLCLLALHNACLVAAAACAVSAAVTGAASAWLQLSVTAGSAVRLTVSGGPAGLDFAVSNGSLGGGGAGLVRQLTEESSAWRGIGWLLAAACVTTIGALMAVVLKKFCGRARALAMTAVVALLTAASISELTAAIGVYLTASARLHALFDSVASTAATDGSSGSVAVIGRGGSNNSSGGSNSGFALAVAADLACLSDLLLLAAKRLAFTRSREAYRLEDREPITLPTLSGTVAQQRQQEPPPPPPQSPPPSPPPRAHRLTSLATIALDDLDVDVDNDHSGHEASRKPQQATSSVGEAERMRRRLERRQEAERRAVAGGSRGGIDNLALAVTPEDQEDEEKEGVSEATVTVENQLPEHPLHEIDDSHDDEDSQEVDAL